MRTKRRYSGLGMLVASMLVFGAFAVGADQAKDEKKPAGGEPPAVADMMSQWAALNAKGPEHKRFEKMVGAWDVETKMWMYPGADPMIATGTSEFRLVFDGRYLEHRFKCPMMGMNFEGYGLEGYDRMKKKYVSLWVDNQSTGFFTSEGTPDADGKTITYFGVSDDPMTGERNKMTRMVSREISDDQAVFEMYDKPHGKDEFKTMEIRYTRRK